MFEFIFNSADMLRVQNPGRKRTWHFSRLRSKTSAKTFPSSRRSCRTNRVQSASLSIIGGRRRAVAVQFENQWRIVGRAGATSRLTRYSHVHARAAAHKMHLRLHPLARSGAQLLAVGLASRSHTCGWTSAVLKLVGICGCQVSKTRVHSLSGTGAAQV